MSKGNLSQACRLCPTPVNQSIDHINEIKKKKTMTAYRFRKNIQRITTSIHDKK